MHYYDDLPLYLESLIQKNWLHVDQTCQHIWGTNSLMSNAIKVMHHYHDTLPSTLPYLEVTTL